MYIVCIVDRFVIFCCNGSLVLKPTMVYRWRDTAMLECRRVGDIVTDVNTHRDTAMLTCRRVGTHCHWRQCLPWHGNVNMSPCRSHCHWRQLSPWHGNVNMSPFIEICSSRLKTIDIITMVNFVGVYMCQYRMNWLYYFRNNSFL